MLAREGLHKWEEMPVRSIDNSWIKARYKRGIIRRDYKEREHEIGR